eukprot:TRINITY_DN424_c0_g1_i1.p1 TRINITY_DN424_c0_g1~~TRINITY_DN424_c0_g1_i1.p1  ORF type:complete len:1199 (+),score=332.07 TRINITY_DN424_c0_g1_i1:182-3778(+)
MYLYNLTLQSPTSIVQAVYGNFSGSRGTEIMVARGKMLELLRPDESGRLESILRVDIFGVIRSMVPFRLTGASKDYVIVGSDSGRIVILEYNPTKNTFDKIHQETFGKSGCRRIVPGQYLATDPKGRAVMIGAVEKQKFVYILNRDSAARLTISSPLEAHKAHTVVYSMCGVDVGFDNPRFACLEQDYEVEEEGQPPQKMLTYYELDLGLNTVVRKVPVPVDSRSNLVITVPGLTEDGPGGVLVCAEDYVYYINQNQREVRVEIPRRRDADPSRGVLIISHAMVKPKTGFFFLLQSEYGDLYRTNLVIQNQEVVDIEMIYYDSIPPTISLVVIRGGFLFAASEFSDHGFYQFQDLLDDVRPKYERASFQVQTHNANSLDPLDNIITRDYSIFEPRPLQNLSVLDEPMSMSPITDIKVVDLMEEQTPQIYALCGRGPRSSIRVMRHGLAVNEQAASELPGNPAAIWTVKTSAAEAYDKYIVVSFSNATLILSIGADVEEAHNTGYLTTTHTLHMANIGEDGAIQVHTSGIRHVRTEGRIHDWKTPGRKTIVHATSNERQVVIALSGGDILYFELDTTGQLVEVDKKFMGREVACLDIGPVPHGRQRTKFLAVGDWDNTVRIFSLDPDDCLQSLSVQALPTHPESLCIAQMAGYSADTAGTLFLNIGLSNGVLLRSMIDQVTGELTDTRTRFLGTRPVKLFKMNLHESSSVFALSSRPWLCYSYHNRFQMAPLSYTALDYVSPFSSEQCPDGCVAITGNSLRILTIEDMSGLFNMRTIPLSYTPRRFIVHPVNNYIVTIETDHNAAPMPVPKKESEGMDLEVDPEAQEKEIRDFKLIGGPKPGPHSWVSCIRLVNPMEYKTEDVIHFGNNEGAMSLCTCVFHDKEGEVFLVVGTAKNMSLQPRYCAEGYIHVYRVTDANKLELVHKTQVETVPSALCPFQGRLLVGCGKSLRIYDMGKKKLLRKCENRQIPNFITNITTQGDRIYISDIQEAIHFAKYKKSDNQIYVFADQPTPRWVTSFQMLDYDTVASADKFGNIFISRLPSQTSDEVEEDPTGSKFKVEQGYLNGAPHKLEDVCIFHTGETVTTLQKTALVPGGAECILYGTTMGTVGALLPFASREDLDFFLHLEMYLRQENPPLCGRDHLSYRSYYYPVRAVIDGDMCEQFGGLDPAKQKSIADELLRTPMEVLKKLEDTRNRLL